MSEFCLKQVRLPVDMRNRLQESAKAACRSLAAEILYRLTQYEKGAQINEKSDTTPEK